jgi:2-(1,2-epoxy-1,2-dihydrophenyl)acetyl-CoA isomerase
MADSEPPIPASLRVERADGVAVLTLNRPDSMNALDGELRAALREALTSVGRDRDVRAVVITGAGRGFCAGADLRGGASEREFRRVLRAEYHPVIEAIRNLPQPVIAAVNGAAAGAGMSLAFATDLVVASEAARFVPAFHRIGLVPDSGLTRVLVRALGRHRAFEILVGERQLDPAEAQAAGLVAAVVPGDRLLEVTTQLARRLASGPTRAFAFTKRLVAGAEDLPLDRSLEAEAALQELAGRTEDHAEGVAAFGERRDPSFGGR